MTKHQRAPADRLVSLSLSLSLSLGAIADRNTKRTRRTAAAGGEFVCKTCDRSFPTFQALGGHRTSHLRGRHGLALALAGTGPEPRKATDQKQGHQCHVCGQAFEMGQALGGHMRRHREQEAAAAAVAQAPPVLLELFV
ncbi:zinc finger protein ZAT8-like [Triticum dicoccoides]|uniref:zinc finger protein ZAT8-like n=1 Tax=Triticum dicoccoides TaxID=85692 RepID=UPI000E78BA4B|nr:zinc finger protein ZAT8-like [Triticum dicoccoides]